MPGFDGKGPEGAGPRTGGMMGYCKGGAHFGEKRPTEIDSEVRGLGRGGRPFGGGRGRGRGMRPGGGFGRRWATQSDDMSREDAMARVREVEEELRVLRDRLEQDKQD